MNVFSTLSAVIAFSTYIPLCIKLFRKQVTQNLASYLLWGVMDLIIATAIWTDQGNFALPAAYTVGCAVTCLCILRSRHFSWTRFETKIALMTGACMIVWGIADAEWATIATSTACGIATIPLIRQAAREPHQQPLFAFWGFLISNILGVLAGSEWTIQERFYPASAVPMSVLLVGIVIVQRRRSPALKTPAIA